MRQSTMFYVKILPDFLRIGLGYMYRTTICGFRFRWGHCVVKVYIKEYTLAVHKNPLHDLLEVGTKDIHVCWSHVPQ